MSETAEIREWAVANGLMEDGARGPLPVKIRDAWEQRGTPDDDDEAPMVVDMPAVPFTSTSATSAAATAAASSTSTGAGAPGAAPRRQEIPPKGRKVSAAERFRQRVNAAPKKKVKRVSIEDTLSAIWAGVGFAFTKNDATIPLGRCLIFQSGVVGIIGEEHLKDTVADKILQPIARAGEQGKVALALAGPPLLVGAITARPELGPVLRPMLHMALMTWVDLAGPAVEKAQRKAEAMTEKMGGLDLDALIDAFWSTDGLPVEESADEEAAVRRARGDG